MTLEAFFTLLQILSVLGLLWALIAHTRIQKNYIKDMNNLIVVNHALHERLKLVEGALLEKDLTKAAAAYEAH